MKDCSVGAGSVVSEKTTLTGVSVGANCTIQEKVKISNCIIMDGVTIVSGSNIKVIKMFNLFFDNFFLFL